MNKRKKAVGLTAGNDISPSNLDAYSPNMTIVTFPVIPKRIVVERPAPPPIRRECPYCGAAFDDYTRRANTLYCRPSCRTLMHRAKSRSALPALAAAKGWPLELAEEVHGTKSLKELESLLNAAGYVFVPSERDWRKA